jgi:pimeloyl-ACP methyl ester carboxylesterase
MKYCLGALIALIGCARLSKPADLVLSACTLPEVEVPAQCGSLEVGEDREARAGRTIRLRVAVIPAEGPDSSADPVFIIVGGPGQSAVDNAASYARLLSEVRRTRALVFVDQRGTGGSSPLRCDLYSSEPAGVLGDFMPPAAVSRCLRELEDSADLRFYNSELAADDLDDVRRALGYSTINLEAASYGTRVALAYLRRHGGSVRSAVLRSVSPPWARQPLDFAKDAQAAFDSLLAACQGDCVIAFPDVRTELDSVLTRLERLGTPLARGPFAEKVRFMLYSPGLSALLPLLIHRAFLGDFEPFTELATDIGKQIANLAHNGMYLSVTCTEDVPQITPAEAADPSEGTFLGNYRVQQQVEACKLWPKGEVSRDFAAPFESSVPVLLISSTIDPVTPAYQADSVARGFSKGLHLKVPNVGHSPSTPCVMGIVTRFIQAASVEGLDTSCLAEHKRPPFAT